MTSQFKTGAWNNGAILFRRASSRVAKSIAEGIVRACVGVETPYCKTNPTLPIALRPYLPP